MKRSRITSRSKHTFDVAQERYREKPSNWGRSVDYLNAALEYWFDDMIGDETLILALHELRDA